MNRQGTRYTSRDRDSSIYKAAWLHYESGLTQKQVAEELGVDSATVSRWLKKAVQLGIVSFSVRAPRVKELEVQLEETFGLKRAHVLPSLPATIAGGRPADDPSDHQYQSLDNAGSRQSVALGKAAAQLIGPTLTGGNGVGLGGGRTLTAFASELCRHCPTVGLNFYALAVSSREPFDLCATSATAICTTLVGNEFRRKAAHSQRFAPPVVEGHALRLPARDADYAAMVAAANRYYDEAMEKIELVVAGIGEIQTCWVLEPAERLKLANEMGAMGDILFDIYGDKGTPITAVPAAAVFPFTIRRLQRMVQDQKEVTVVSTGKIEATYHALACPKPFVTGIITDEHTANEVLTCSQSLEVLEHAM